MVRGRSLGRCMTTKMEHTNAILPERRVAVRRKSVNAALSTPYKDWADYFERSRRVGDDFVAAMEELRRSPFASRREGDVGAGHLQSLG